MDVELIYIEKTMHSTNIVIVGPENTGKTCLFHRYANDIFLKFTPARK